MRRMGIACMGSGGGHRKNAEDGMGRMGRMGIACLGSGGGHRKDAEDACCGSLKLLEPRIDLICLVFRLRF